MTNSDALMSKADFRAQQRQRLVALSPEELVSGKMRIFETLWNCDLLADSTRLMAFHPHNHEVDIRYFMRIWLSHGRDLFLPKVAADGTSMEVWKFPNILAFKPGYRGIPEPDPEICERATLSSIDAILVPGLAYSPTGQRLGQGGGHYDRFLARLDPGVIRIGVCYDWQVGEIPCEVEPHDQAVDYLAAPAGLTLCVPGRHRHG